MSSGPFPVSGRSVVPSPEGIIEFVICELGVVRSNELSELIYPEILQLETDRNQ
jgi:hypothetical protein